MPGNAGDNLAGLPGIIVSKNGGKPPFAGDAGDKTAKNRSALIVCMCVYKVVLYAIISIYLIYVHARLHDKGYVYHRLCLIQLYGHTYTPIRAERFFGHLSPASPAWLK